MLESTDTQIAAFSKLNVTVFVNEKYIHVASDKLCVNTIFLVKYFEWNQSCQH
jgi:hypothetical protein